ncbi:MAG: hypothetical protein ONB44_06610 [candidate division KSB1 bacterium]|nr:hypothetical protein [candidate division KSB1 bacterium]MDZ7301795.1 hypothetical protein [candidate division KSB1 bacterium]MDZ7311426.1 hypothetical protein [candidate division KSB1 bacterium]
MNRFCILCPGVIVLVVTSVSAVAQTLDLTEPLTAETRVQYEAFVKLHAPKEEAFVAVQRIAAPYIQARQFISSANHTRHAFCINIQLPSPWYKT